MLCYVDVGVNWILDKVTVWTAQKKIKVAHTRLPSVGDMSHKLGGRLPLLSARPAVTPATLKRAATNFAASWTEARWV